MKISKKIMALGLTLLLSVSFLSGCNSGRQTKSSQGLQKTSSTTTGTNTSTPSSSNSTEGVTATTTTSNDSSIVIPQPEGWEKVDSLFTEAEYTKGTASFIVKTEIFKSRTLEDIAKEDTDYLVKAFDKAKFIEPEKMKVGSKDAIKVTFTDGEGPYSMKIETILVMSGVSTYTITCGDLENSFDAAGFDKILGSIEFK